MNKSNRNVLITLGVLAALIVVGVVVRKNRKPGLPDERDIPAIMQEAMGKIPVPASDTPGRRAVRDSFKYLLEEDKSYTAEVEERYRTRALVNLMKPHSFAHAPLAEEVLAEMKSLRELEERNMAAVARFREVTRENLTTAGIPAGEVAAFDRGMEKGMASTLEMMARSSEADIKWIEAVIELYRYAIESNGSITVTDDFNLGFSDEGVRARFEELSAKVDEMAEMGDKASAEFNQNRENARKKFGMEKP